MIKKVYIADAIRTPIGNYGGTLKNISAVDLGTLLIKKIIERNNLKKASIDGVIMGNVLQAGLGQNPARQCSINGGLSDEIPCFTINKTCASSLKAVDIAYRSIASGHKDIYIAGGMESMSGAPYLLKNARWGYGMGNGELIDEMLIDGLWCPFNNKHMGELVADIAEKYKISREEQDDFSFKSHKKALRAIEDGRFADEIIPVDIFDKKGKFILKFKNDEHPRNDCTIEKLSSLKPVFKKNGTITAGNSSGINDGAAALLVASGDMIKKLNLKILAEIISITDVGVKPELFGLSPIKAVRQLLSETGLSINDIEIAEFNEAFAAQTIIVLNTLKIKREIVNVNGGAIAFGHPIGASGTRIVVTLIHEMIKRKNKIGLASLCIGSGEGMALLLKRS
jgi:acetyl-CoA C-acetyltransferase